MLIFTYDLIFLFLLIYIFICRYFRYYYLKLILSKYNHVQLDYSQSQDITQINALYDMPLIMQKSLAFALFRTYGIPTIAHLLVQTNQLAQLDIAGRRAEDTGILLTECFLYKLDSDRARMGLARINYLHGLYKNRISNDDMLYTLSLFILEPIRWIKKYEWRSLCSIEEQARFLYYKELGIRMKIKNIPLTLNELEKWANNYEIKNMIYSKDYQICGEATLALMIKQYPKFMENFIRKISIAMMDERLRLSMGFEEVPIWIKWLITLIFNIRAFILCYFAFPRIYPDDFGQGPTSCPLNKYGRYQRTKYTFEPWYVKETWLDKILSFIGKKPDRDYKRNGFKVEEVGPEIFAGKGIEIMEKDAEKMKERAIEEIKI